MESYREEGIGQYFHPYRNEFPEAFTILGSDAVVRLEQLVAHHRCCRGWQCREAYRRCDLWMCMGSENSVLRHWDSRKNTISLYPSLCEKIRRLLKLVC